MNKNTETLYMTDCTVEHLFYIWDTQIGDIILKGMGIDGKCTGITRCRGSLNDYTFTWRTKDGTEFKAIFNYYQFDKIFKNKIFTVTIQVNDLY